MADDDVLSSPRAWLTAHADWAPLIIFALALLESLPGVSLLVPATALLLGIGVLVGSGTIEL